MPTGLETMTLKIMIHLRRRPMTIKEFRRAGKLTFTQLKRAREAIVVLRAAGVITMDENKVFSVTSRYS